MPQNTLQQPVVPKVHPQEQPVVAPDQVSPNKEILPDSAPDKEQAPVWPQMPENSKPEIQEKLAQIPAQKEGQEPGSASVSDQQPVKTQKIVPVRKAEDLKSLSPDFQVQSLLHLAIKESVGKALDILKRAHIVGYVVDKVHDELVEKFEELEKQKRI